MTFVRRCLRLLGAASLPCALVLPGCSIDGDIEGARTRGFLTEREPAWAAVGVVASAGVGRSGSLASLPTDVGSFLLVADEDDSSLVLLDPSTRVALLRQRVSTPPHQVVPTAKGVLVVHARGNEVVHYQLERGFDALRFVATASRAVATEPVAAAVAANGQSAWVVSAWGRTLTELSLPDLQSLRTEPLAREPRAVTVSDDGERVLIAHAVGGTLTEVPVHGGEKREHSLSATSQRSVFPHFARMKHFETFFAFDDDFRPMPHSRHHLRRSRAQVHSSTLPATQGFALVASGDRVFVPQAFSNPGELGQPAKGYGASGSPLPATMQDVAVVHLAEGSSNRGGKPFAFPFGWPERSNNVCRLPRAVALDPVRDSLWVACIGADRVVEFDASGDDPGRDELSSFAVPRGPSGLVLDAARRKAYVWSRFDRSVSELDLPGAIEEPTARKELRRSRRLPSAEDSVPAFVTSLFSPEPTTQNQDDILAGMALFHKSGDEAISGDGRACASCHPGARDDGLRWRTPGVLLARQTPMLDGRIADTAPYGWLGEHVTLTEHLENTVKSRLRGKGLSDRQMAQLVAYLQALPGPPVVHDGASDEVARGEALYHRDDVGCGDCHDHGGTVDGLQHAFGRSPATDTPSLRFIAGAAPFFHDGAYQTLEDVLLHTASVMGQEVPLNEGDRGALLAYLRTL